ncbi:hypothetical protein CQ010_01445 [Arthrobacter sp. MYb211]|uniref:hypothetical protein n=1 Tax=unclassified Arthrobacter TaxID=235627 RepID=UPI000CFC9DF6|nr:MULTISPECIES: hypothetical protein [unclassified Arthrobacter]PRA13339.1 hypothetical protein CQ015_03700 [Arthrobacter sp. MYb221]PRC10536.1 hypothetical protein CQ010_01445 [Arthrobacter sp. MYb211]
MVTTATAQQIFTDAHSIAGDELRAHTSTDLWAAAELAVEAGDAKAACRLAYYAGMTTVIEDL